MALADRKLKEAKSLSKRAEEIAKITEKEKEELTKEKESIKEKKKKIKKHINNEAKLLNEKFRTKWLTAFTVVGIYAFILTAYPFFKSERCNNDLIYVIEKIISFTKGYIGFGIEGVSMIWDGRFSQFSIKNILVILIGIIVALLLILIPLAVIFIPLIWLATAFEEHCRDELSIIVPLICSCITIFAANIMPCNVVLFFLGSQIAYIVIRWYIDGYRESRNSPYYR